ncbi:MAG: flagellar export protein FliJ [Syntrophomonadaceae bacterium]|nr:flagellar export protein FliJ [Syntrophomonadaceae bacterium]
MKRFVFRLQTNLDIAEGQEKLAIEQLALKISERDIINEQLKLKIDKLKRLEDSFKYKSFKEALLINDYLPVLRAHILEINFELKKAEEKVEIARNILIECKKETKTLTKLKEKEWKAYLNELNIEEQKEIDEIAINKHFRNN